jgi:hypothetical protein
MRPLYDSTRHEPLSGAQWDPYRTRDAVAAICRDAERAFDIPGLWPPHPRDLEPGSPPDGAFRGLYLGAAGMIHALGRVAEAGLYEPTLDLPATVEGLHEAALAEAIEANIEHPSNELLLGAPGTMLLYGERMRFVGAGHGLAGIARALLGGADCLGRRPRGPGRRAGRRPEAGTTGTARS